MKSCPTIVTQFRTRGMPYRRFSTGLLLVLRYACLVPLLLAATIALAQEEPESTDEPEKPQRSQSSERSHRGRDVVSIGDDIHVKEDDKANDVVVVGGNARIDGTVDGDVVCVLGRVILGTNAVLKRDLVAIGGLERPDTAVIRGEKVVIPLQHGWGLPSIEWVGDWIGSGVMLARPLPHQYVWSWTIAGVFLLIYILLAALFPRPVQASVDTLQMRPGGSLVAGLLTLLLIIPLIILLVVTVVGIIVVPFLVCGFVAVLLFGKVAVYRYAGQQIGHSIGAAILEKPLVALLVGAILFYLLYTIPILGFIVWGAIVPFGIGAVLLALFQSRQSAATPKAPPVMVPYYAPAVPSETPPPAVPVVPSRETPTGLVRVGFWLRFLATALDFVLIAIVSGLIFRKYAPAWFIPIWVIYHIGMWGWKGTTIGGIILNLKIVRLHGTPINLVIALVRCLAAFLSAAVVFLGFFWAGWSADKQAWHDKIAGTCVVKYPKGLSLI